MENKVLFDGIILNEIKLSQFNTILLRVQNKQEYTTKDGKQGSSSCTMVVSAKGLSAEAASKRFKRGDSVRIQGALQLKKTDKIDEEGKEMWEVWIRALKIDPLAQQQNLAPVSEKLQSTPATIQQNRQFSKALPQNYPSRASSFNNQPLPIPLEDPNQVFEEVFSDELPF